MEMFIEYPEKLFKISPKKIFVRFYALEALLEHLTESVKHPCKKERLRSQLARKTIKHWFEEGDKVYERLRDIR